MRWDPTPTYGGGFDFWKIKIDNSIGQIDEATVFGDPNRYPSSFTTFIEPSTGLNLLAYFGSNVNLGKEKTFGVDFDLVYRHKFSFGDFRTNLFGTYIFKHEYEVVPGQGYFDDVGKFINGGMTAPLRLRWNNVLSSGDWEHTIAVNYLSSYDDDRDNSVLDLATNQFVSIEQNVKSYMTWDWQTQWQLVKNLKVTAGIFNIFNAKPPLSITTNGGGQMIGYNADFSNPQDRTWYGNVTLKF